MAIRFDGLAASDGLGLLVRLEADDPEGTRGLVVGWQDENHPLVIWQGEDHPQEEGACDLVAVSES